MNVYILQIISWTSTYTKTQNYSLLIYCRYHQHLNIPEPQMDQSFHSQYNTQFYTTHPHIHQVIAVLLEIQTENTIKINRISKNVLNVKLKEITEKKSSCKKHGINI